MCYSIDFKSCVLSNVFNGMSWDEASEIFNVSRASIARWCVHYRNNGTLEPGPRRVHKVRKVDRNKLVLLIESTPDATLQELADYFETYPSVIDYHCRKLKLTRKKNTSV